MGFAVDFSSQGACSFVECCWPVYVGYSLVLEGRSLCWDSLPLHLGSFKMLH